MKRIQASPWTQVEKVRERMRVVAYVVDKCRAAIPENGGYAPENIIGGFAREHASMVEAVLSALRPFAMGLSMEVGENYLNGVHDRPVINARWVGEEGGIGNSEF